MNINLVLSIIAGAVLCSSCKDNSTEPPASSFSVKISVNDVNGNAVPGLRISAWSHLTVGVGATGSGLTATSAAPLSISTIGFSLAIAARVNLSVFEFDGTPVSTLVEGVHSAGAYQVNWQIQKQEPTRVYRYRLVAQDTASGGVLFRDSLYAVLWQPDAEIAILGWTSSAGTFETVDQLLFPNVLDLPPLIHTLSYGPDSIGTFAILDTVTFVLTDTTTHQQMQLVGTVSKGAPNHFSFVWNPRLSKGWTLSASRRKEQQATVRKEWEGEHLFPWKLSQNYPNPFN